MAGLAQRGARDTSRITAAPELWIKDLKRACYADRLSDHRFWATQFRLILHAAVYWLLDTLRRWLSAHGYPHLPLDTLRLRLLTRLHLSAPGQNRYPRRGWAQEVSPRR